MVAGKSPSGRRRFVAPMACALALLGGGAAGCSGDGEGEDGGELSEEEAQAACENTRDFFNRQVWTPVMGEICIDCHSPGGIAIQKGAKFQLMPAGYPGFLEHNFQEVQRVARVELDGTSQILLKPLGDMDHGGAQVLQPDSQEYQNLAELVDRLSVATSCTEPPIVPEYEGVELLGPAGTLRKAALHLVGRLPTPDETQRVVDGGEEALPGAIFDLTHDDAFYTRLKEIYNDLFLTDQYLAYTGYAINILNDEMFPISADYYDNLGDDLRRQVGVSVAREPLELIAHIVRNDRPFTEMLTANYTVVDDGSAAVYNISPPGAAYGTELREAKIQAYVDGQLREWPHAGVLTSPMFLNRFPTTDTNLNRHRARMVFEFFLATDILEIAARPIDPTESAKYINPTRDDPSCNHCHRQIDPIAGAFMKFDDNDQERYEPGNEWYPEMFAPGFAGEDMEVKDFDSAPQWLAQRIVADPRFALSVVYTMFEALTGQDPTRYPDDPSAEFYEQELVAWQSQDATLQRIAATFVENDYNLRHVVRDVILTPYFRATNAEGPLSPEQAVQFADVGTGRLSTPELLSRKIQAVAGIPWARNWDQTHWLRSDYEILYGGIDSEVVTSRLTVPNGVMAAVQWRMANEVACAGTAWDFNLPQGDRYLFRHVQPEDTPVSAPDAIRRNIQYMHAHFLGEDLELGDPEVDRTYRLFEETWREGSAKVDADELSDRMNWSCRARWNPYTREELPEGEMLEEDGNYSIRSWQAVVTYLLADHKFLYE